MDSTPSGSSGPLYHEISPAMLWLRRIFSGITILMVALAMLFAVELCHMKALMPSTRDLAMLFCLIQGKKDGTFYLLFVNLVISCVIISFLLWWYRTGDLSANKFWFIILVASVIIFQCITTDIFVFNHEKYVVPPTIPPITKVTSFTIGPPNATTKAPPPGQAPYQNIMDTMFTKANTAALPEG